MKRNKSRLLAVLCTAAIAACAGTLTGCLGQTADKKPNEEFDLHYVYECAVENGFTGSYEDLVAAIKGETGNGIASITKTTSVGNVDTYTITYTDGTTSTFTVTNGVQGEQGEKGDKGDQGADGNGILSIEKDFSEGLVDHYTITFTDGTTFSFTVTNGAQGDKGETGATGDKGETGDKGDQGETGKGISKAEINAKGELIITYTDGTSDNLGKVTGNDGAQGDKGETGAAGDKGETGDKGDQGVGIEKIWVDEKGNLCIKLTNGTSINAGNILDLMQSNRKTHTVTYVYVANGETHVLYKQSVADGAKATEPSAKDSEYLKNYEEYVLGDVEDDWYYNYNGENCEWSFFGYTVTEDMTLYLYPVSYSIEYQLPQDASYEINGQSVKYDALAEALAHAYYTGEKNLPTVDGSREVDGKLYVMAGWQTIDGQPFDPATSKGDVCLTPVWKEATIVNFYYKNGNENVLLHSYKLKDGATLAEPTADSWDTHEDLLTAIYEKTNGDFDYWYYMDGEQEVKYDFTKPFEGAIDLFMHVPTYTIGYQLDEDATYYMNGTSYNADGLRARLATSYQLGEDVIPEVLAYKKTEGTEEQAAQLSVMEGWVTTDGQVFNTKTQGGNLSVMPKWKTVDYGYVSEGLSKTQKTTGEVYIGTGSATTSYTAAKYQGSDTTVIISGDDITHLGGYVWINSSGRENTSGTGTVGTTMFSNNNTVRYLYIIAPNLKQSDNSKIFSTMSALNGVVIASDNTSFDASKLVFDGCAALKSAVLNCPKMTKTAVSMFNGCAALESVVLPESCTALGDKTFAGAKSLDIVENFGWDTINTWTTIGSGALSGVQLPEELVIDATHFSKLVTSSTTAIFSDNSTHNTTVKKITVRSDSEQAFALNFAYFDELTDVVIDLPNATSISPTFNNEAKLKTLSISAPKATTATGSYNYNEKLEKVCFNVANATTLPSSGFSATPLLKTAIMTDDASYEGTENLVIINAATNTNGYSNLFSSMNGVEKITVDVANLTRLGYGIFGNNAVLKTVEVKDGTISVITNNAFQNNPELTTVTLPAVAEGTYYATDFSTYNSSYAYTGFDTMFAGCKKLASLSNLGAFELMFRNMSGSGSQSGSFPYDAPVFAAKNGLGIVGTTLFSGKSATGAVVIPAEIEYVSAQAFAGSKAESISFAEGSNVQEIKNYAFANCADLISVDMKNATLLKTLGTNAFEDDTKLETVLLSESKEFTALGAYTFKGATALKKLHITDNIKTLGENLFRQSGICELTFDEDTQIATVGNYLFAETTMNGAQASEMLQGFADHGVTTIAGYMFYRQTVIDSIVIPEKMQQIGSRVFSGCSALVSVSFAGYDAETNVSTSEMTSFGSSAFEETAITSIVIQPKMTKSGSFFKLQNLNSVKFAVDTEGKMAIEEIESSAFSGTALTSLELPSSITTIGGSAFKDCKELKSLTVAGDKSGNNTLPAGVSGMNTATFQNCTSLTSFVIPASWGGKTMNNNYFNGCTSLATITVPGDLKYNSTNCFSNCNALKTVYIVKGASEKIANGTGNFTSSTCKNSPWYKANANNGTVYIGEGITEIADYAFNSMPNLTINIAAAEEDITIGKFNSGITSSTKVTYGYTEE